jgi:hypothetical protein
MVKDYLETKGIFSKGIHIKNIKVLDNCGAEFAGLQFEYETDTPNNTEKLDIPF